MESSNVFHISKRRPIEHLFGHVEIVKQARFLLNAFSGGVKLTAIGNLPRKLTQDFWESFIKTEYTSFRPSREADCFQLGRLRFLLIESGFASMSGGKLVLSQKGRQLLESEDWAWLYRELFTTMMNDYEWSYDDRYGILEGYDYPEIQAVAWGMLSWLIERRPKSISPRELMSECFEIELPANKDDDNDFLALEPVRCLQTRFFERFCVPFGLMTDSSPKQDYLFRSVDQQYPITTLLLENIGIGELDPEG